MHVQTRPPGPANNEEGITDEVIIPVHTRLDSPLPAQFDLLLPEFDSPPPEPEFDLLFPAPVTTPFMLATVHPTEASITPVVGAITQINPPSN